MPVNRPQTTLPQRFGVFEIDPSARELRKRGIRVKLQDQPFAVLLVLLEKPGQLVTKEELQQRLWPADTFVEFDKGIYNAMKRLREALGDEAETPRYIETLPRRGYRFIAPVATLDSIPKPSVLPLPPQPGPPPPDINRKTLIFFALLLSLLLLAAIPISRKLWSPPPVLNVVDSTQITNDGLHKDVTLKLLTDGTRLYFQEGAPFAGPLSTVAPVFGGDPSLIQVSTQGGETVRIPVPLERPILYDFSVARSEFLAGGAGDPYDRPLWAFPLPTGPPRRVGDIFALDACWSPDGNHLAFNRGKDLFVALPDGSDVRKVASLDARAYWIQYSPDGSRLRFTVFTAAARPEDWNVMEVGVDGKGLRRLPIHGCCGKWSANGKLYFYQTSRDVWVLPEWKNIFGKVELGLPAPLTTGPMIFGAPTPSTDGKYLFVVGNQPRIELVRYDRSTKKLLPFLGGISAGELEVSADGQWVTYSTYPESNLWRSRIDGSERLQLTFPPLNAHEPRWSPDGKQILFTDVPHGILVVSADGGTPQRVIPKVDDPNSELGAGFWSADGNSIIFVMLSESASAIYQLNLTTQELSKIPGSDGMGGPRVSRNGRYLISGRRTDGKMMLYDLQTQHWSEFVSRRFSPLTWSTDSKFVYMHQENQDHSADVIRISVPAGKVETVLHLKGITLGGYWPTDIGLSHGDSVLLSLDKNAQEIYRLALQHR